MYRVYYTDPKDIDVAKYSDTTILEQALKYCERLRDVGMIYVVMVTDYNNMVGKPGATAAGQEYVPQMLEERPRA